MSRKNSRDRREAQALNKRLKEQHRQQSYLEKLRRAQKKERDQILTRAMKRASETGVYKPKELKLTKYRRMRATKAIREYGDFLDPRKYFFIKTPKPIKAKAFERAESLEIKHSRTGLFIAKEGHKKAILKTDRKRKELYIERVGKTKRGPSRGVRYKTITPLASIDELDFERDRLRRLAKAIGPLRPNERITFRVIENGLEGYSHTTFSNIELLINYLEHYRKSIAAKVNFFRHIQIEKTTTSQWFAEHPATTPGRKGRAERDQIRATIRRKQADAKEAKKFKL